MSAHLDEASLEALAAGHDELVAEEALEHVDECETCAAQVALERIAIDDASVALRRAIPEIDLDSLVATAMERAPRAPAPSRRSLWLGAIGGIVAAITLGILSLPGAGAIAGAGATGRQIVTLGRALDRVVESVVPGGWSGVALLGLVLGLLMVFPMRLLLGSRPLRGGGVSGVITGALTVGLLALVSAPSSLAHAYRLEGAWPRPEPRVSVDVENQPTSEALRQAANAAGLGIVLRLPEDTPVTLRVENAPIGEVVEALLGQTAVVVRPSASLISVRPDEAPAMVEPTPAAEPTPEPAPEPAPAPTPEPARAPTSGVADRVTFGGDVVVGEGEIVGDVVTMGGDAAVRGRAFGDVVTMGGDAEIDGEVIGNVVTMGGDIHVGSGAQVHGDLEAMGGQVEVDENAVRHGRILSTAHRGSGWHERDMEDERPMSGVVRWALFNVLLFLFGLFLLGTRGDRLATLRAELGDRPVRSALGGFFGGLAAFIICGVLVLTLIGIPAAMVLGLLLVVGIGVGWTTSAWWLGGALPLEFAKERPVVQLGVGLGALFLAGLVPVIGTLIVFAATVAGLGAVIATSFGQRGTRSRRGHHVPTGPFRARA